jgi:light-regulated signal transduction histidine kinase (bacteriophytochrome)
MVAVDLNEVASGVVGDLEASIAEVGADVVLDPLPVVLGDAVQLRQVLQNLLSNALKFHREGEEPRVRVTVASHDARTCVIAVEDNGIGFDEKYAERIFGTFQRLHSRGQYEGTGIGLSIARKIAWRHEGDISASGVLGEGSTFKLTLRTAPPGAVVPREVERSEAEAANQRSAA